MFLDRIIETKRVEVEQLRSEMNRQASEEAILKLPPCRSFKAALTTNRNREVGLIAEVKKASPSKGLIREDFEPVRIAKAYERAGADTLSVLTDVQYFQGGIDIFKQVRQTVDLPLLRKEFIISEEQIIEARLIGADAILLIAAVLNDRELQQYIRLTAALGMESLIEVHDEEELARVQQLEGVELLGINNRNLKTFVTDIEQTYRLQEQITRDVVIVSESGIHLPEHMVRCAEHGIDAVLIGEHFMRQADVEQGVLDLMSGLHSPSASPTTIQ